MPHMWPENNKKPKVEGRKEGREEKERKKEKERKRKKGRKKKEERWMNECIKL